VISYIIAFLINLIPSLHLRASIEAKLLGMDDDQLAEFTYDYYVEVRRDDLAWTPAKADPSSTESNVPQHERHGVGPHQEMLMCKEPSEASSGEQHTAIGGDRHAVPAKKKGMHRD